jgi:hypothetical protein
LKEVTINGKVGGNCQGITFDGGSAADYCRKVNNKVKVCVIFSKEIAGINAIGNVNSRYIVLIAKSAVISATYKACVTGN